MAIAGAQPKKSGDSLSVLIIECLQHDFVDPIGPYDPLPNRMHVGHTEALRLLGEDPSVGPLAQLMDWAQSLPQMTSESSAYATGAIRRIRLSTTTSPRSASTA